MEMEKWKRRLTAFTIGGAGYTCIELIARGRSHWSMTLMGGVCCLSVCAMMRRWKKRPIYARCVAGALIITGYELLCGLLVNRLMKWNVWDYSMRFGNVWGQICPLFTLYWMGLCLPMIPLSKWLYHWSRPAK